MTRIFAAIAAIVVAAILCEGAAYVAGVAFSFLTQHPLLVRFLGVGAPIIAVAVSMAVAITASLKRRHSERHWSSLT
jgi:hypothetical protein